MQRSGADPAAVRRSVIARVLSGFWLQPFFTAALVLEVALSVIVASFAAPGQLVLSTLPSLPLLVLWLFGVTAYARVDGEGVRWRYFRRHVQPWAQIDYVRFGTLFAKNARSYHRLAILVAYAGREVPIMPTYGCSTRRVLEFGDAVAARAIEHGRPVYVTSSERWQGLARPAGVVDGEPPGPRLGRGPIPVSIQVRLFALALLVIGVLGLIGAITGWDTTGLGERITVGIVGGLLLLVGALLAVVFLVGSKRAAPPRLIGRDRLP